jgi:hypothetical protein
VESLAKAFAATVEENRIQQSRLQRLLAAACAVAGASLGLSIWALTR